VHWSYLFDRTTDSITQDNFAHDIVRYDMRTMQPYQGIVTIDAEGEFDMVYVPVDDPLIMEFLDLRRRLNHPPPINRFLQKSETLRRYYAALPFAPNLSVEEYIPTRLLSLLQTLRSNFPRHRLLLSGFLITARCNSWCQRPRCSNQIPKHHCALHQASRETRIFRYLLPHQF